MITLTKTATHTPEADLFGAFDNREVLTFTLTALREEGISDPVMEIYRDDDGATLRCPFSWAGSDYVSDRYVLTLSLASICAEGEVSGLFWYTVRFTSPKGHRRLSKNPHSYAPVVAPADWGYSAFQLTVYEVGDSNVEGAPAIVPNGFAGGMMYHIFVDRFARGGDVPLRADAILEEDWYGGIPQFADRPGGFVANNLFFGGTLWGVADKLDYLASLGVTVLYLSPIFEAYSNHKYDTGDYRKVDEMFGGDAAFDHLIAEAHCRGIKVILDGVFNHTGSDSRYFNRNGRYEMPGAYQSKESPYYDWFDFEEYPDRYRCWWGIEILPAVTTKNPDYREFICGEDGVIRHYLRRGADGWRLDVADELDRTLLEDIYHAAHTEKPNAAVYGEVWEDASNKIAYSTRRRYFRGHGLDAVMNYPLKEGVIDFIRTGCRERLFEATAGLYSHYPKATSDLLMNFLGTHDTERVLTVLGGIGEEGRPNDVLATARMPDDLRRRAVALLKLAFTLVATLPGIPCVYYGDEAGMEGYHDPFNRMPYPWGREEQTLVAHYAALGKLRAEHRELFGKGYLRVREDTPEGVFAFERWWGDERILVAVNRSHDGWRDSALDGEPLFATAPVAGALPPDTAVVLRL
ncbi:MAG: glycoside hydrolase family 13 protein [Clostridia bacterium]|nr:glycoside hydrolase family 13 protein [Clostridia bacterium]